MTGDITRERTVHALLERQAAKYGERTFLYFGDQTFSYREFEKAASRVACGLQRLGIRQYDMVSIIMDNCPEYFLSWLGLSKLGAVEVPINTAHKGYLLTYMLEHSDTRLVIVQSQYIDRLEPVLASLPKVETVVILGARGEGPALNHGIEKMGKRVVDWEQVVDNDGDYEPADVRWSDPWAIMFTSGTTGPSKGALMPNNYAIHIGEIFCEAFEYNEHDRLHSPLPLFHGVAQLLATMAALVCGAEMVLVERFSAASFWDEVKHYQCTSSNYVGTILPILCKADPRPDDPDNPLRVITGGGVPKDVFEPFEKRFGLVIGEAYGMNEIGLPLFNPVTSHLPPTCLTCRDDYMVKIVDDNGQEVGPNTPGELLIRPLKPYVMLLEYYNDAVRTVEAWRDLWFHTGDYLRRDEDGYFHFVDRKKDALRRRGENISSYEVEKVINSHPGVLESAAVASKSDLGEDEVLVCLVLKPGQSVSPEELTDYCADRMAYFMVPRYLRFLDALPKTPTQRIEKYRLRSEGVTSGTWDRDKAGYKLRR